MNALIENLRSVLGRDQLLTEPEELLVYECDGLTHYKIRPRAVVFPHSTEEVSEVVRVLARAGVPFAPRGAGTGLSGGALALEGGVQIELARMRRVLELDVENRLAVIETGLVNAQLSRTVAPYGLHYAPDPSSQATCTIGGNIAENAGGIHCLKYGTTVDHVLRARVVLSDGEVVDLGNGQSGEAGYDLVGLFVGSEGTFGVATEATVRLTPNAPAVRTLLADFADVDDASRAVSAIIAEGLVPAALEMIDGATIRAVEASVFAAGLPTDAEAALLVELDGLEAGLDAEAERVEEICLRNGARRCRLASDERERRRLWAARKGAFGAMGRISPDLMLQDAVVPRSRLPEVLADVYRTGAKYRLRVANVFHAGDGNLHPFICFDSRDTDEVERVHEAGREIMETCVRAGGTITGEHGVGLDKSAYLSLIYSDVDLDAMLRVRAAFDPAGICNPGKIIPMHRGCGEARAVVASGRQSQDTTVQAAARQETRIPDTQARQAAAANAMRGASAPAVSTAGVSRYEFATRALASITGEAHVGSVRAGETEEALTVAPADAEEACEILRLAARERWAVVPAGAGGWLAVGEPAERVPLVIKTTRMSRVVEHQPADLVATVEAGATLDELNATLGGVSQWLPLDPPGDGRRSTVGGIAATGLGGAQSLGYGTPRNHVLGMRVALSDGRVIKAGGRVVKNVAGYDMCKLFVGSHGTLGLILELTFKLRPRPAVEATLVVRSGDYHPLLEAARALGDERLSPVALELLSPLLAHEAGAQGREPEHALLIRFAGTGEAVEDQLSRATERCSRLSGLGAAETLEDDSHLWRRLASAPFERDANYVWRAAGVRPTEMRSLLDLIEAEQAGGGSETMWHAGLGDGRLRVSQAATADRADVAGTVRRLDELRRVVRSYGGQLVVERAASDRLRRSSNVWGIGEQTVRLMRRIKRQLDEDDIFSPGLFGSDFL